MLTFARPPPGTRPDTIIRYDVELLGWAEAHEEGSSATPRRGLTEALKVFIEIEVSSSGFDTGSTFSIKRNGLQLDVAKNPHDNNRGLNLVALNSNTGLLL